MNKVRIAQLFFVLALTSGVFLLYLFVQPPATYAGCALCDAHQYGRMYDFFEGSASSLKAGFPYYSRAFVPLLASLAPGNDVLFGFQMINFLFSLASVAAIFLLWEKLRIPVYLMAIGIFWLLFHWTGIIRLNAMDPVTADVPTYLFQTIMIFLVVQKQFKWLLLLGPLAVLQRESILVLLLVLLVFSVAHNYWFKKEEKFPVGIVAASIVLTILVKFTYTSYFPPLDGDKSSVRLVLFYIKEVLMDPFKLVRWIAGIFMAFGALLLLSIGQLNRKVFASPFMVFLLIMSALYLALGIIAGGDSTRIVFLGFPFIMTWILLQLRETSWIMILIALLMSAILMKLERIIPDPGRDFLSFAQWYPEFAEERVVWGWILYCTACSLILFIVQKLLPSK